MHFQAPTSGRSANMFIVDLVLLVKCKTLYRFEATFFFIFCFYALICSLRFTIKTSFYARFHFFPRTQIASSCMFVLLLVVLVLSQDQ